MTTFVASDIPPNVNTLEELAAWALITMRELNPSASVLTSPGKAELAIEIAPYRLTAETPARWCLFGRVLLTLNPLWESNGTKIWANVSEFSTLPIPVGFKS